MSKGNRSDDFACPGCQEQFDTVTHIPFVGSCGHSLCGICFNEKTPESCPVCNKEGSFASKGRNELAIKLLTALVENEANNSMELRLFNVDDTNASEEPIPAIVNPENRPFLAQIVNQLDSESFLNLAKSCKTLYNFCFNSKDIKITYFIRSTWYLNKNDFGEGTPEGFLGSSLNRKKLKKYPFHFQLTELKSIDDFDEDFIVSLRSFLSEFPIVTIEKLFAGSVNYWPSFVQFLKDFRIEDVTVNYATEIPEDVAAYLLQNTEYLTICGIIADHLLLNASVRGLELALMDISQATFIGLLKRFANSTERLLWQFDKPSFGFGHYDLFKVMPLDYEKPLPEERPLIFASIEDNDAFYILRKDDTVLRCSSSGQRIKFTTYDFFAYPPVFPERFFDWDDYWSIMINQ